MIASCKKLRKWLAGNVNHLPVCHTKVAAKPQIFLNPVHFFKCVDSCLSLIHSPFETLYQNGIQKSNDKNRPADTRLQKKSVNVPKLVLKPQQEELMRFLSLEITHRFLPYFDYISSSRQRWDDVNVIPVFVSNGQPIFTHPLHSSCKANHDELFLHLTQYWRTCSQHNKIKYKMLEGEKTQTRILEAFKSSIS